MRSASLYTAGWHAPIYRPVPPEAFWREEWWERRCPTDFAAAYQKGRLLNQLNWYCQLAVSISFWGHRIIVRPSDAGLVSPRNHEQPIRDIIRRLEALVNESVDDNPAALAKRIEQHFGRFREHVSSSTSKEHLLGVLKLHRVLGEALGQAREMRESACVSLGNFFIKPFIETLRSELQTGLTGSKYWAFSLGEAVDAGVRRPDVGAFLNRPEGSAEHGANADDADSSNRLQTPSDHANVIVRDPAAALFDPCIDNHPLVNFRPVAGSILPQRSWSNDLLKFARHLGIEGVLKLVHDPSSPMQFTFAQTGTAPAEVSCTELATMVQELDRRVYSALCERESEWFHREDETPPADYKVGPVRRGLKEIARQLEQDERTVKGKARAGVFWVRKLGRYEYEFFFKNQAYERLCRQDVKGAPQSERPAKSRTQTGREKRRS